MARRVQRRSKQRSWVWRRKSGKRLAARSNRKAGTMTKTRPDGQRISFIKIVLLRHSSQTGMPFRLPFVNPERLDDVDTTFRREPIRPAAEAAAAASPADVARQAASAGAPQHWEKMASPAGFEPATSSLEGCCSIHLSYGPVRRGRPPSPVRKRSLPPETGTGKSRRDHQCVHCPMRENLKLSE